MIAYYSYLALGAFLFSLLGTRMVILGLRKKQFLIDLPNARSNHKHPTPRGGGIAVVMALVIFLLMADSSYSLILGMLMLAAVSLLDDWISLSPLTRLLAQALAVMVALAEVQIPALSALMPPWLASGLIALAWLWFINLYNFMDGIDGITAAESISIAGGLLVVTSLLGSFTNPLSQEALIVLGAGFGFLWWNWHPAKIFIGDVGSIPLGYLLGYMLLIAAQDGYIYAALILPAYYLLDASITLGRRIAKREKIWEAHSSHFYQRAVRGGLTHDRVVIVIFGVNMLLAMLATLAELDRPSGWLYLSIAYGMVLAVLFFYLAKPHRPELPTAR